MILTILYIEEVMVTFLVFVGGGGGGGVGWKVVARKLSEMWPITNSATSTIPTLHWCAFQL